MGQTELRLHGVLRSSLPARDSQMRAKITHLGDALFPLLPRYLCGYSKRGAGVYSSFLRPTTEGWWGMLRSTVSKVMWVGRATVFLVGLAVILAVVLGVATAALAGTGVGAAFNLGKLNTVNHISRLVGSTDNPMLRVDNNGAGTNATALDLQVEPDHAPMKVNSSTRVAGLNADLVDGKGASQFMASSTYMREFNPNGTFPNQGGPGTLKNDGTRVISQSCDSGDRLLSGGPASVDSGTTPSVVLDSFPSDPVTWT